MTVKKLMGLLHLWTGLVSGLIVFIVCITGSIYVFRYEIESVTNPEFHPTVHFSNKLPLLPPSTLASAARGLLPGWQITGIEYFKGKASEIDILGEKERGHLFLDPFTGKKLGMELEGIRPANTPREEKGFHFFSFIVDGHTNLWLPQEIGRAVSNYATLVFVFLLISGIVLWWPKNKAAAKQRLQFKWKNTTQWKRKNYDLHNILGFYSMLLLLLLALSGMRIGLRWVDNGMYWLGTGMQPPKWENPVSDTITKNIKPFDAGIDQVFNDLVKENANWQVLQFMLPDKDKKDATFMAAVKFYQDRIYHFTTKHYWYDQYTFREVKRITYSDMTLTDKIRLLNWDIHMGTVFDLPSKIITALSGLVGASLPITGFYIWWGRRNKISKRGKTPTDRLRTTA